jgi:hypothetical protein
VDHTPFKEESPAVVLWFLVAGMWFLGELEESMTENGKKRRRFSTFL